MREIAPKVVAVEFEHQVNQLNRGGFLSPVVGVVVFLGQRNAQLRHIPTRLSACQMVDFSGWEQFIGAVPPPHTPAAITLGR